MGSDGGRSMVEVMMGLGGQCERLKMAGEVFESFWSKIDAALKFHD